jgi:hypothetical protein
MEAASAGIFGDASAVAGEPYSYRILANSLASKPCNDVANLRRGWRIVASEGVHHAKAQSDGECLRIQGARMPAADHIRYAFVRVQHAAAENSSIAATLSPLFASQSLHAGIGLCSDSPSEDPVAMVLLEPAERGMVERVNWVIRFDSCVGSKLTQLSQLPVPSECIDYGRLMKPLTFQLERSDSRCTAFLEHAGQVGRVNLGEAILPERRYDATLLFDCGFSGPINECSFSSIRTR